MALHAAALGGATHALLLGAASSRMVGLAGAVQTDHVMCPLSLDLAFFQWEGWRQFYRSVSAHLHG